MRDVGHPPFTQNFCHSDSDAEMRLLNPSVIVYLCDHLYLSPSVLFLTLLDWRVCFVYSMVGILSRCHMQSLFFMPYLCRRFQRASLSLLFCRLGRRFQRASLSYDEEEHIILLVVCFLGVNAPFGMVGHLLPRRI